MSDEDEERFNHTAYAYRMAPATQPAEVVARYEALLALARKLIAEAEFQYGCNTPGRDE